MLNEELVSLGHQSMERKKPIGLRFILVSFQVLFLFLDLNQWLVGIKIRKDRKHNHLKRQRSCLFAMIEREGLAKKCILLVCLEWRRIGGEVGCTNAERCQTNGVLCEQPSLLHSIIISLFHFLFRTMASMVQHKQRPASDMLHT